MVQEVLEVSLLDQLVVPIPKGPKISGWKEVEIKEPDELEPLVNLAKDEKLKPYIILSAQYHQQGISGSLETMWAREGVADALFEAAKLLPKGYKLMIWDAWRPTAVQQALFDEHLDSLRKEMPELSEEELREDAQKYVSLPSRDPKKPSPHNTGGAIDLTIVGPDRKELDMGTKFDHFGPRAHTRYYEELPETALSLKDLEARQNRRLLYFVMIQVGFTNYPEEWWHFDLWNQFWGRIKGKVAIYGRAAPVEWINPDEECQFTPPPPPKTT